MDTAPDPIYLDHNATAPLLRAAREAMEPFLSELRGNPSSIHEPGRRARAAVEEARVAVAALVNAPAAEDIVFTSGATESDVWALRGVFEASRADGRDGRQERIATGNPQPFP